MGFQCQQCLACCQKYWITVLPQEASQEAEFLNLPLKTFINDYCQLYLQLFPAGAGQKGLTIPASFVPQRIKEELEQKGFALTNNFMVLPWLAFKRIKDNCIFLETQTALCIIHPVRPKQCALFPFISLKENEKDFQKLYPFCVGLKTGFMDTKKERAEQLERVKAYFAKVKEKGFTQVWPLLPQKGKLFFKDELVTDLTQEEFLQLIKPFQ